MRMLSAYPHWTKVGDTLLNAITLTIESKSHVYDIVIIEAAEKVSRRVDCREVAELPQTPYAKRLEGFFLKHYEDIMAWAESERMTYVMHREEPYEGRNRNNAWKIQQFIINEHDAAIAGLDYSKL